MFHGFRTAVSNLDMFKFSLGTSREIHFFFDSIPTLVLLCLGFGKAEKVHHPTKVFTCRVSVSLQPNAHSISVCGENPKQGCQVCLCDKSSLMADENQLKPRPTANKTGAGGQRAFCVCVCVCGHGCDTSHVCVCVCVHAKIWIFILCIIICMQNRSTQPKEEKCKQQQDLTESRDLGAQIQSTTGLPCQVTVARLWLEICCSGYGFSEPPIDVLLGLNTWVTPWLMLQHLLIENIVPAVRGQSLYC